MVSVSGKSRLFKLFKFVSAVAVLASTLWRLGVIFGINPYFQPNGDAPSLNDFSFLSDSSSIPELPIFYLNADGEKDRQRRMEEMFEKLGIQRHTAVRVPIIEVSKFEAMLAKGQVVLQPNIAVIARPGEPESVKQGPFRLPAEGVVVDSLQPKNVSVVDAKQYSLEECARLLSHLEAILQAYQADHKYALILEDNASLNPGFVKYWKTFAKLAPDDWNILQWHTDFDMIYKQGLELADDPWIFWKHEYRSARANMYSRKGMRRILELVYSIDERMQSQWIIEPSNNAEETLHYYGKQTYTSTKPWIDDLVRSDVKVSMAVDPESPHLSKLKELKRLPKLTRRKRLESILVLTQYRLNTIEEARVELDWLDSDAKELCSLHSVCEWHVNVIVTDQAVFRNPDFTAIQAELPPNVFLYVKVENRQVNKYSFIASFVDEMPRYDLVLLKDYDHRITGFPWNTFVSKKGAAIIASPLHQFSESEKYEGLHRAEVSTQVPFHDGHSWQGPSSSNWASALYESVTAINTPYLDSYFVLLDADFAKWFFSLIRIPDFIQQGSEWGPDLMWCGAAQAWKKGRKSCHLVPLVAKYEDGKINPPKLLELPTPLSPDELENVFRRKKSRFTGWMTEAKYWRDLITGTELAMLKQICMQPPFDVDPFSLQECINQIPKAMSAGKLLLVAILLVLVGGCILPLAWCYRKGKGFRTGTQSLLEIGVQRQIISRRQQHSVLAFLGGYLAYADSLFTTRSSRIFNRRRTKGSVV